MDQSEAIQKILQQYEQVYFPPGYYLIGKSLALKDHQALRGSRHTVFLMEENSQPGRDFVFFTIDTKKDITIRDIQFEAKDIPTRVVIAIRARNVIHLTLKKLKAINCALLETWPAKRVPYAEVPAEFYSEDFYKMCNAFIDIDSCYGTGSERSITERTHGILLYYASDWKITRSELSGYNHGVVWWGGDSDPRRDGDTVKIRKCQNGLVSQVTVDRIRNGGIWGSMGQHITVRDCIVSNCHDVGIDFEGCYDSQAVDNIVTDGRNGCIAVFHYNKNILFKDNRLVVNNPKYPLACIYNAAQRQDNGKVVFSNNAFTATRGVGLIKQQGPSRHIEFVKNKLHNVVVNFSFNNNQYVLIRENTFRITQDSIPYDFIIKAGQTHFGGTIKIEKNKINNMAAQKESLYALSIYQSDYNSSPVNRISGNKMKGIDRQLKVEWAGANRSTVLKTYVDTNRKVPAAAIKQIDSGKAASELYINGSRLP